MRPAFALLVVAVISFCSVATWSGAAQIKGKSFSKEIDKNTKSSDRDDTKGPPSKDRNTKSVDKDDKSPPGRDKEKNTKATDKSGRESNAGAAQQKQNLAKLKSDLEVIHGKSQVTPQQKQAVAQDLYKILSTANKPSQASVQSFANDLTKYLADGKITTLEAMKLTQDIEAVLASANISQQDEQKLMRDVQTLLKATNLTQADMQTLYRDVQAIVTTAQQNHSKTQPNKKKGS